MMIYNAKTNTRENVSSDDYIRDGIKAFKDSERYKKMLEVASKFYRYSATNQILIALQDENASYVAGFKKWAEMGYKVNKGAKSLTIRGFERKDFTTEEEWAAWVESAKDETAKRYRKSASTKNADGSYTYIGYPPCRVFDIAQTNCDTLNFTRLNADFKDFEEAKNCLLATSVCPVEFKRKEEDARLSHAHGFFSRMENKIVVCSEASSSDLLRTLVHEIAHSRLHAEKNNLSKDTKEFQAESVAYIVCNHLGLDTSDISFEYLSFHAKDFEKEDFTDEFKKNMDVVNKCAREILDSIHKEKEKEPEREEEVCR